MCKEGRNNTLATCVVQEWTRTPAFIIYKVNMRKRQR